jgi:hypothetical protein
MIALLDCIALSGAISEEVVAIAMHENLPPILAAALAHHTLTQPTGTVVIREMIMDEYGRAAAKGDLAYADRLAALFAEADE